MPFHYSIGSIEFSDGSRVELPPIGVTVVVGANNVGKSRLLREISSRIGATDHRTEPLVTNSVEELREGTAAEFHDWLAANYIHSARGDGESLQGIGFGIGFGTRMLDVVEAEWKAGVHLGTLGRTVATHLDTGMRLVGANAAASYDAVANRASEPLQALYEDPALEDVVSANFRRAFGSDLVVDRHGGSRIALRCGRRPVERALGERLSIPYGRAVRSLELLDEQGDGMRSYASCLLHSDVWRRKVVMIDEPEAFLHPPQARILAQHLAKAAKDGNRQIILATHSSDVVRGALDGGGADVSVVRLTRGEKGSTSRQLDAEGVRKLWEDPLLRASNLLDALFYERLVLCEADGDCRFYNAVLESICEATGASRPNVMFSHTSGKARLPGAAAAIAALGVPVDVIGDLDVLSEEQPLRAIWEALGREWTAIQPTHRRVKAAVDATAKRPAREHARERLKEILDSKTESTLDDKTLEALRSVLKAEGGWAAVKRGGLDGVPKGNARKDADNLVKELAGGGVHLVPVGELEGFLPQIGGHGPPWVVEALRLDLAHAPEVERARTFVRGLNLIPTT